MLTARALDQAPGNLVYTTPSRAASYGFPTAAVTNYHEFNGGLKNRLSYTSGHQKSKIGLIGF